MSTVQLTQSTYYDTETETETEYSRVVAQVENMHVNASPQTQARMHQHLHLPRAEDEQYRESRNSHFNQLETVLTYEMPAEGSEEVCSVEDSPKQLEIARQENLKHLEEVIRTRKGAERLLDELKESRQNLDDRIFRLERSVLSARKDAQDIKSKVQILAASHQAALVLEDCSMQGCCSNKQGSADLQKQFNIVEKGISDLRNRLDGIKKYRSEMESRIAQNRKVQREGEKELAAQQIALECALDAERIARVAHQDFQQYILQQARRAMGIETEVATNPISTQNTPTPSPTSTAVPPVDSINDDNRL